LWIGCVTDSHFPSPLSYEEVWSVTDSFGTGHFFACHPRVKRQVAAGNLLMMLKMICRGSADSPVSPVNTGRFFCGIFPENNLNYQQFV
jgi:hypothetical protein